MGERGQVAGRPELMEADSGLPSVPGGLVSPRDDDDLDLDARFREVREESRWFGSPYPSVRHRKQPVRVHEERLGQVRAPGASEASGVAGASPRSHRGVEAKLSRVELRLRDRDASARNPVTLILDISPQRVQGAAMVRPLPSMTTARLAARPGVPASSANLRCWPSSMSRSRRLSSSKAVVGCIMGGS